MTMNNINRILRFLWLMIRFPLVVILLVACLIATPILWIQFPVPVPWWAYGLASIGALFFAGMGVLILVSLCCLPFILADEVAKAWRRSDPSSR